VSSPDRMALHGWAPDGTDLFYTVNGNDQISRQLWRIPAGHGTPERIELPIAGVSAINQISLSPDGRHLAYTENTSFWELWIHEHFLPAVR
jgi:WD40 repeat protein